MDVVNELSPNAYDGIYASTLVRSHETAAPRAEAPGEPITVLAGLREIEAGAYEGQPEANAEQYATAPLAWLRGDHNARIPGSIDGNEFDARFDEAVLMNVSNPDKSLLSADPVPNTVRIVVNGNPRDGWTLVDWDGKPVPR